MKNKAATWVFEALEHVVGCFPFPIVGIDGYTGVKGLNALLAVVSTPLSALVIAAEPPVTRGAG